MITKDINGNTLSQNYDDVIKSDSRKFLAKLLNNGTEIPCAIKRIEMTAGSCSDSSEFTVGSVVGYQLQAELSELTRDLKGEIIELQIGLLTDEENETWEWIKMGEFVVSEAKKTLYTTNITANGRIVANSWRALDPLQNIVTDDGEIITASQGEIIAYPPVLESQTLAGLAIKIAYRMGCAIQFASGIDTTLTIDRKLAGMTIYQVLQIMATVIGGYVSDTPEGNVKFYRYSDTPTATADSGMMTTLPEIEEGDFNVTGIKCVVSEGGMGEDGTVIKSTGFVKGAPVNLVVNSEYETAALFDSMSYIIGYGYRPGSINLSLGDPRLEGSDVVEVTDADGSTYIMPCHQITHIYDGGFSTQIEAVPATNIANDIGTLTPFQRLQKETKSNFTAIKENIAQIETVADNTAQHFWMVEEGTDTGAHITEKTKEDFLDDPDDGGGNMLIRSTGMAVRDGLIELASFGSNGVIIGRTTQSRQEITYHAMKMISADGETYLHISDLRNAQGIYQATDAYEGDGTTTDFLLTWDSITASTVAIDGIPTTAYTLDERTDGIYLVMDSAPAAGTSITCIYDTTSEMLKAYTLGTRKTGTVGGFSVTSGYNNRATGKHTQAHGHDLDATGDEQMIIGKFNRPDAKKAVILGNGDSVSGSNALTIDWDGHIRQITDGTGTALGSEAISFINGLAAQKFTDSIGFKATDVDAIDPYDCLADGNTLDYISIIVPLVKYVQELEARITALGG